MRSASRCTGWTGLVSDFFILLFSSDGSHLYYGRHLCFDLILLYLESRLYSTVLIVNFTNSCGKQLLTRN
jgi:hypothetical protein